MNTKIIKLDLNRRLYDKIIAKQGDTKSRFLLFQLLDGSIPFYLTNRSVRAYMVKPDGKEIFNDLIINNYSLGYCTLELTNQVLAVPGTVKIELMVTEEDRKLTSSVFELEVIKSINSEKSIVSTNEFTALLNGLSSLSEYDNYKNEIAAARDGEVNLLTKVKKIDEQLDTKANKNTWGYNQVVLPFTFPKEFKWTRTLPNIKIKGGQCLHDIEVSKYEIKGKTYYVDIKTGLGSNDGLTPETALTNIQAAIDKGDAETIIVGSGWYEHSHGYISTGILIDSTKKALSIKAKGDGDVYISANSYNLSFALESGYSYVYSATRSGVGRVIDIKYKDSDGEFLELTKVSSISKVESTVNSYYTDNSKVYIHTKDNRPPDDSIKCLFNTIYTLQFHKDLYLEGIKIIGGMSALKGGSGAKLYAKNCEFKFSTLENGLSINSSFCVIQNCKANNNYLDGFNYNGGEIIEVDCQALRNGILGIGLADTQNGSTQHNGGKIVRINCEYGFNKGSNLGDNHANTQSVNFNIVSHDSRAEKERYSSNFTAHTNSNMWLVNCVSFGSKRDFLSEEGATLYYNSDTINYNNLILEGTGEIICN